MYMNVMGGAKHKQTQIQNTHTMVAQNQEEKEENDESRIIVHAKDAEVTRGGNMHSIETGTILLFHVAKNCLDYLTCSGGIFAW